MNHQQRGTIDHNTPIYTWNAVENSTRYRLWVDDSTGNMIKKWYSAEDANCPAGTGTLPPEELPAGGSTGTMSCFSRCIWRFLSCMRPLAWDPLILVATAADELPQQ